MLAYFKWAQNNRYQLVERDIYSVPDDSRVRYLSDEPLSVTNEQRTTDETDV